MDKTLIIGLAVILVALILLNGMTPHPIGGCAGTRYGCCPNGVTPKIDYYGSNCYNPPHPPLPPYPPYPPHPPLPPHPIGGCAGTRYGCCPDGFTPKIDMYGSNCS